MKNKILYNAHQFQNIREILNNTVKLYPKNVAFKIKNKKGKEVTYTDITYEMFQNDINEFGTGLVKLGFRDKRVAVIGKNSYEWALTYFSVLNGVGVLVPLDKGLPEAEIELSLKRSKAEVIVFESEYEDSIKRILENNNTFLKQAICMKTSNIENILEIDDVKKIGRDEINKGNLSFINSEINNKKMAAIIFTSGTTSLSKAVMLSHYNIASNIYSLQCIEKVYSDDVNMAFLPFHHTFGSTGLLFFIAHGATNVFCDGLRYIQDNLKEYQVSVFVCVPLLLEAMYKKIMHQVEKQGKMKTVQKGIKICNFLLKFGIDIRRKVFKEILDNLGGKLRFVISGASAIDKNVAKGFSDFGILTVQGYGLTETSPVLVAENEKAIRYGSIGFPIPNVEIKIDNPNEEGIGELIAKGPNVMLGYYEDEKATADVMKDGWFYTGDLAKIDKDGFIFITGRKKNVLVLKNGKNVYPEELELLLNNLPYVAESMVFGLEKDDDLVVSAKIVYDENYVKEKYRNIGEEELKNIIWNDIKNINKGLPTYKYIKNLIITSEPMVKTTTAKVKRHEEIKKM
ncbi:MAG: long-chain fatty acid--CoA ligase [Clostridiales bacterium]|nr:long-chain fatty acid--CoA ligase [Clostridiales bacterium]